KSAIEGAAVSLQFGVKRVVVNFDDVKRVRYALLQERHLPGIFAARKLVDRHRVALFFTGLSDAIPSADKACFPGGSCCSCGRGLRGFALEGKLLRGHSSLSPGSTHLRSCVAKGTVVHPANRL